MKKNQVLTLKNIASIGEEIGLNLGTEFITDYQVANPSDTQFYVIGRNIIDQILAQPGCVGMRFYNAYNEKGEKTLVYVGLNESGKTIVEYSCVNNQGVLETNKGIIADRAERGSSGSKDRQSLDADNWGWTID